MKGIHAIPAGLVLLLMAAPAQAAPVGPQLAVQPPTAVHKVHGSHRSCQYSPRSDWWHRHIGPYRRAIDCGRQYYYYDDPYYYYDDPYWYGPGITFRFGDRHRFRGHRFDGGQRFRGGHEGRRGRGR